MSKIGACIPTFSRLIFFFTGRICIMVVFCTSHYLEVTVTSIGNFVIGIWYLFIWCFTSEGPQSFSHSTSFCEMLSTIFGSKKRMNHWFANRIAYYNIPFELLFGNAFQSFLFFNKFCTFSSVLSSFQTR